MEESKELQGFYKIFRAVIYISVLLEFFEYAIDPATLDSWGGILSDANENKGTYLTIDEVTIIVYHPLFDTSMNIT